MRLDKLLRPGLAQTKAYTSHLYPSTQPLCIFHEKGVRRREHGTIDKSGSEKPRSHHKFKYGSLGPPEKTSRVRPLTLTKAKNETEAEKFYRLKRMELQTEHHKFWLENNQKFLAGKEAFEKAKRTANGDEPINADDFAEFYTKFLKENEKRMREYNLWWCKKNFTMLIPAARANFYYYQRIVTNRWYS
ncbi:hypothetical protein SARC_01456 [Sphaeroforma arctica JP610]|uniref:Apoptogenic protein 1, mitochondrial n=1 Tax=Sphaeroforma arctica JP610 TaxID=667725 RepID=A0A0L0GBY5_9EUKA|nr:hypothetical protein SARC_01456 [Sphaeroforma arctica JP610]KNC86406.1 hypothetical protein SARC_01456 [Sphaeroforma arctica JP610]|eukprot:XP_014160308.1 hypothetical protein SARC_01456 [Sphaeroforma arctica JP610]